MLNRLRGHFSHDLFIDPGTANTLIYIKSQGIVLNEPSIIALQRQPGSAEKTLIAVGTTAKDMLGRTPKHVSTVRPMRDGVIADFKSSEAMLQHFIKKVHAHRFSNPSPRILLCAPQGATQVERRAIKESALSAGARAVDIVPEAMAAAVGAGIAIHEPRGSMVLDIGAGTSEIAVISLNGIVYAGSIRVAGDNFDEAIARYVRCNYGILIGEVTAERIKIEIGSACPRAKTREISVNGRSLSEGMPRSCMLNSGEVLESLEEPLQVILGAVRQGLENTPPDLGSDIADQGIVLTGGSALLRDLDKLIAREIGVTVRVADDPLTCVVRGGGQILGLTQPSERGIFCLQ